MNKSKMKYTRTQRHTRTHASYTLTPFVTSFKNLLYAINLLIMI